MHVMEPVIVYGLSHCSTVTSPTCSCAVPINTACDLYLSDSLYNLRLFHPACADHHIIKLLNELIRWYSMGTPNITV